MYFGVFWLAQKQFKENSGLIVKLNLWRMLIGHTVFFRDMHLPQIKGQII